MVYVTIGAAPVYHQMSLEEFLFGAFENKTLVSQSVGGTRTYELDHISPRLRKALDCEALLTKLKEFNASTESLRRVDRHSLYHTFLIPKKSGGMRRINAPNDDLKLALRNLKAMLESDFKCLYHTAAHAYVRERSVVTAMRVHQSNESKWFAKLDLHDFFGSTTLEFVMRQFSMIYPFCELVKIDSGYTELKKALELGFLDGGLPQGTPLSPIITNVMMIPIDFKLSKALREKRGFAFTRYADDFQISSKFDFDIKEIVALVKNTLGSFGAPFSLNEKKTRYGSSSGRNWNLGLMLNKDNQLTVGRKRIRQFQNLVYRFITDASNGSPWDRSDVQVLHGQYSYYRMVEKDTIDRIIAHIDQKMDVDVVKKMLEAMAQPTTI